LTVFSASTALLEKLFNEFPNVVFFAKDSEARYTSVNNAMLERFGFKRREQLIGMKAEQVYPTSLGSVFAAQDEQVLKRGIEIRDKLELHIYPGGRQGWCLTFKTPLRDGDDRVRGLVGLSRDLHRPDEQDADYPRLARAIDRLQQSFAETVRLEELAQSVGLSLDRFERMVRRVFYITPRELLIKTRIEAASKLLVDSDRSIADIGLACGYCDHSAFTRQFRATAGMTPAEYRGSHRGAFIKPR
jgi:PAS domain S-box-containing protein